MLVHKRRVLRIKFPFDDWRIYPESINGDQTVKGRRLYEINHPQRPEDFQLVRASVSSPSSTS